MNNWHLPEGYVERLNPAYCENTFNGLVYQPDVYNQAVDLARGMGRKTLIDLGCGHAGKLVPLFGDFRVIGVDTGPNIEHCKKHYDGLATWIDCDLEKRSPMLHKSTVARSVIICADVIEHLVDPTRLLTILSNMARYGARLVISTPERDRVYKGHMGPPANPGHVREWTTDEFLAVLKDFDLIPQRFSVTRADDQRDLWFTLTVVI